MRLRIALPPLFLPCGYYVNPVAVYTRCVTHCAITLPVILLFAVCLPRCRAAVVPLLQTRVVAAIAAVQLIDWCRTRCYCADAACLAALVLQVRVAVLRF